MEIMKIILKSKYQIYLQNHYYYKLYNVFHFVTFVCRVNYGP